MFLRAFVLTAFGLAAIATSAAAAENCQLQKVASLPTTKTSDGRLLVDIGINGTPKKMLVDTGVSASYLDPGFIKSHDLPWHNSGHSAGYGLSWRTPIGTARVTEFTLGEFPFRTVTVNFGSVADIGGNTVGGLGDDVLSAFDIELNPAAGRINFFSRRHCVGKVVYWADEYSRLPLFLSGDHAINASSLSSVAASGGGADTDAGYRPEIEITLDGQRLWARIDTGVGATTMREAAARRLFGVAPDSASQSQISGVDGVKLDSFLHRFHSLTVGDIPLNNPEIRIAKIDVASHDLGNGSHMAKGVGQSDIYLGMSMLKHLHMFIAYGEPAVYFTVADPQQAAPGN
jgi:predicted aspartyl protease